MEGIILPSYMGVIISQYKNPYEPTSTSFKVRPFFFPGSTIAFRPDLAASSGCWCAVLEVTRGVEGLGKSESIQWRPGGFKYFSGWYFQTFFIFTPTRGNDPIWLVFFRWVETTNQFWIFYPEIWGIYNPMWRLCAYFSDGWRKITN